MKRSNERKGIICPIYNVNTIIKYQYRDRLSKQARHIMNRKHVAERRKPKK